MTRDIKSNVAELPSIDPQAMNATVNGGGVDTRDYDASMAVIYVGAWTDGTHDFTIEHSDDDGVGDAYTAIPTADLDGALPSVIDATQNGTIVKVGIVNNKRYVRVVNTVAGATTGLVASAHVAADHAHQRPVA